MVLINLLLLLGTGLGLWVVGALLLSGHLLEAFCVLGLVVAAGWSGHAFARRAPRGLALTFVSFCVALNLEAAAHMAFGMPPDLLWAWLNFGLHLATGPLLIDLATQFPTRRPERRWLVPLAYGVTAAVFLIGAMGWLGAGFNPMDPEAHLGRIRHFNAQGKMYGTNAAIVVFPMQIVTLVVLAATRRQAQREGSDRVARQSLLLMLGMVIAGLPSWAYTLGLIPIELGYWFHAPPALFRTFIPMAGVAALLNPYFHSDQGLLRRVLIGLGMLSGGYLIYLLLVQPLFVLMERLRPGLGREPAVFVAALFVALLLRTIKDGVTGLIDRVIYPHLVDLRALLQEASRSLATTIMPKAIAKLATEELPGRLGVAGARLLVLDDLEANLTPLDDGESWLSPASPVWAQAQRSRGPAMLREAELCQEVGLPGPALMLPLRVGGRLVGIYLLGARHPVAEYSRDQLDELSILANHLAVAVENGRALRKIDALSQRALAEVEERNRLAREIHDTIAQGLTAASLQLDVAEATVEANPTRSIKAMERAHSIVRENLAEARRSVLQLRAPLLGGETLPSALVKLVEAAAGDIGATGSFQLEGSYRGLPAQIETQLYRIAQEALHNAVKYSSAGHLEIGLWLRQEQVTLSVSDDGAGFDLSRPVAGDSRGGFGIAGMRERVRLVGGALHLTSEPGEGTLVQVTVPLEGREG